MRQLDTFKKEKRFIMVFILILFKIGIVRLQQI